MSRKNVVLQRMKDMDIQLEQIAQHIMLNKHVLSSWIVGNKELPYKTVLNIADFLTLDPEDLLRAK